MNDTIEAPSPATQLEIDQAKLRVDLLNSAHFRKHLA